MGHRLGGRCRWCRRSAGELACGQLRRDRGLGCRGRWRARLRALCGGRGGAWGLGGRCRGLGRCRGRPARLCGLDWRGCAALAGRWRRRLRRCRRLGARLSQLGGARRAALAGRRRRRSRGLQCCKGSRARLGALSGSRGGALGGECRRFRDHGCWRRSSARHCRRCRCDLGRLPLGSGACGRGGGLRRLARRAFRLRLGRRLRALLAFAFRLAGPLLARRGKHDGAALGLAARLLLGLPKGRFCNSRGRAQPVEHREVEDHVMRIALAHENGLLRV